MIHFNAVINKDTKAKELMTGIGWDKKAHAKFMYEKEPKNFSLFGQVSSNPGLRMSASAGEIFTEQ